MTPHHPTTKSISTYCTRSKESIQTVALRWPWVLLNISIYIFALPWMLDTIMRFFVNKDYSVTPGLDDTYARIFFISAHIGLGLICLVLYPLQFIQYIRLRFPKFHRWSGRISLVASVFTSLCGMVFICLKKFQLVGGIKMGVAFFTYGLVLGTCAILTGYFAVKREFRRHKNWAIRSYSQIMATVLYRYYYAVQGGFGVISLADQDGLNCNDMDVCEYFLKPFDKVHAWTFFIAPLLFTEMVLYMLRDNTTEDQTNHCIDNLVDTNQMKVDNTDEENMPTKVDVCVSTNSKSFLQLNVFGIVVSLITLGSTIFIFVTAARGTKQW